MDRRAWLVLGRAADVTAAGLRDALVDARRVELALLDAVSDDRLLGERAHFLEPPIWEMGHVGWFQEYWIHRHPGGADTILPGSDGIYDSFNVSYKRRWDHRYPSREQTCDYITTILYRSLDRLERRDLTTDEAYFYTLAALHEDMHAENLALILHTLGYPRPALPLHEPASVMPPIDPAYTPRDVAMPGGPFLLGADPDEPFVFDNEKWAHPVEVAPFRISSTPVTNAEFRAFVDDGGYRRRELWSRRGWDWRRRQAVEHPLFWRRGGDGDWYERRFDATARLEPWHPVACVNWYEAEAYCRWAKRRLPIEAEWEMAATAEPAPNRAGVSARKRRFPWSDERPAPAHANLDYRAGWTVDVRALADGDSGFGCRQMIGNVWEWTADTFMPYPGFVADPYAEYSQPYFGQKKVLRGGAWTTRTRLIRPTYRNFYKPHRRNIFAGFRTCRI
ncbi:MAG: ergothioneine biosynthesis protein EgtB [Candidatus Rokubacteria bacterium]|nr:ergothioneine biosynthesis protein EgtB [Candidatus Rokubacteria bacterium]